MSGEQPWAVGRPRVVLVAMPWESIARPSLAIGTLCALATRAGFDARAVHLDLDFAASIGGDLYAAFAETLELFPLGEHLFACDLFGTDVLDSASYLATFGAAPDDAVDAGDDPLRRLRDHDVPRFLDAATARLASIEPDVVGFSCTFNQVLPSLALAARFRAAVPATTIVFGGACVHGEMGLAYLDAFGHIIDHVFTGEADESFVTWLELHRRGEGDRAVPGVAGRTTRTAPTLPEGLDDIPVPDFSGFFEQHHALAAAGAPLPEIRHIPYESSRGCWWGERSHCTFCGLNNDGMHYRRRSSARVLAELDQQSERHGMTSFMAADNILDFRAYGSLLGELAARPTRYDLFYEIKSNIHRDDVGMLRRAGVWRVQPGIESFVDHVLVLMRKGVSALRNVQLLKWLHEHGIAVDYNVLVGFPGETAADYAELVRVIARLRHLPPPNGRAIVVRVDRFSPFHDDPASLGIVGVRAATHHRHLIPLDVVAPDRYAYFFERDLTAVQAFEAEIASVDAAITAWKEGNDICRARLGRGFVELQTYRSGKLERRVLRGVDAGVFIRSDAQVSVEAVCRHLEDIGSGDEVRASIDRLVEAGVLLAVGDNMVNLIPFSEPHTQAELDLWAVSCGLPRSRRPRQLLDVVGH